VGVGFVYQAPQNNPALTIDKRRLAKDELFLVAVEKGKFTRTAPASVPCHEDLNVKNVTLAFLVLRPINFITQGIKNVQSLDLFGGFWTGGVCCPHAGA
jgi:hypothetical protein